MSNSVFWEKYFKMASAENFALHVKSEKKAIVLSNHDFM